MTMQFLKGRWDTVWWAVATAFLTFLGPVTSFCPPLCSCDDSTLLTDCHEARNLKMVPIFLNPQTKFLSLSQNQIKEISMSLQFYSELQLLDFSQNQIESLGGNNFENLRNLKVLNASYNSIRVLDASSFSGLSQAIVIDLSVNQIERIDPGTFKGLLGLRDLALDRNRLETLDWDLFSELGSLERLSLHANLIRILQPPVTLRPFLTTNNSNNGMSPRSESEKLWPLTFTTEAPWALPNIVEVDLSWNQLAAVRNFGLVPLLPSLRTLNLCCNYIHTVEEAAFSSFPTPSTLPGNNKSQVLQTTPPSGLTRVNLSQNRLTAVPTGALEKLSSSLVDLDLSSNRLREELPAGAFRSLVHLRRLSISKNTGIVRVDPGALTDNIHLVSVEANHLSNLTDFPLGLLTNKPYLERLSFQFAQIRNLPGELFTNPVYAAQIDSLDLFGNPIDCNCSVWKLYEHVVAEESSILEPFASSLGLGPLREQERSYSQSEAQKISLGSIQCYSPTHLQEYKIRDLTRSDFEHCFDQPPFHHDYFELLVIILAALIVFLILTAVAIKLCCLYRICPHHRRQKSLDLGTKNKEGTTLDEFCSNVVLGNGGCESASLSTSCASGGKVRANGICQDFSPNIPPSPALSSCSKNRTGTLPNGSGLYHGNGHLPVSYHRSPRTTTLGPRVPVPYDYDDEEERYHQYMTINNRHQPSQATLTHSNKLRFNPKMQLVLDNDPGGLYQQPPLILHYEYNFPDEYRRNPGSKHQRCKQVPSVLV